MSQQRDDGYLIVGKNGFVAKSLIESLTAKGKSVASTTRGTLNGTNEFLLELDRYDGVPTEILKAHRNVVFLAAISSPDICSKQQDFAYACNVTGTARFIRRCLESDARVLFFASDTVYGPTITSVDETTPANPIGEYALMKRQLEETFQGEPGFKSARMSYVVSPKDKFTSYLTACCTTGKHAEIFHPFIRSPIWLRDVIESISIIFDKWDYLDTDIINLAGPEELSRLDLANLYRRVVDDRLQLSVVEPPEEFFTARPQKIVMNADRLEKIMGRKCTPIEHAFSIEFAQN